MEITPELLRRRTENLRRDMRQQGFAALVVFSHPSSYGIGAILGNIRYLTDWSSRFGTCLFVLPAEAEPALLVPEVFDLARTRESGIWVQDVRCERPADHGRVAQAILRERRVPTGTVGLVGRGVMPGAVYLGLTTGAAGWEFQDADHLLAQARLVKEPLEIQLLRKAALWCDTMLEALARSARAPGKWVWQLMADMEHAARAEGAEYSGCWLSAAPKVDRPRFVFDENMRQLQEGDQILAGTYIMCHGYWGHSIRMGFKGEPPQEYQRLWQRIQRVQSLGAQRLQPGLDAREVSRAMESAIAEFLTDAEAGTFGFRVGHGLGLDYSEPHITDAFPQPGTWSKSAGRAELEQPLPLKPGMVVELHPNFLDPAVGGAALGDMFLVTETGAERLTRFPQELMRV